jgi:hypothetical protein
MSDGTPLEDLESGSVTHAADAGRMNEILRDMNASGAEIGNSQPAPPTQPMPPMQPMQPMTLNHPMMYQQMMPAPPTNSYVAVEDAPRPRRKNAWSSALGFVRDPIIVAVLMFVLSLPVLHTFIGKYANWAFAVGGQLSWLGLGALSLLAGVLFGVIQGGANYFA